MRFFSVSMNFLWFVTIILKYCQNAAFLEFYKIFSRRVILRNDNISTITGGEAGRVPGLPAPLRPRRPEHGDCDHGGRQLPGPVRRVVRPSRQTKEQNTLILTICAFYCFFLSGSSRICLIFSPWIRIRKVCAISYISLKNNLSKHFKSIPRFRHGSKWRCLFRDLLDSYPPLSH